MLCRITQSFLASATRALPIPDRFAMACAQSFSPDAGHTHQKPARRVLLRQRTHRLIEDRNLFAQLTLRRKHGSSDGRQVIMLGEQGLDPSVKRKAAHCARQHSERLEHAPDMVRQTRRHADELCSGPEQRARPIRIQRLHVH
jgi:hypothetical protein